MKPGDTKDCPKCGAVAVDLTPIKQHDPRYAVFGCQTCGFAFTADGKAFVSDAEKLRDIFRGATLGKQTLRDVLAKEKLSPATRAIFTAKMLEYGVTMWYDGLRQGLLLGAFKEEKNG